MKIIWKDYPKNNKYIVSNMGNVINKNTKNEIGVNPAYSGYRTCKIGKAYKMAHTIVAETFIPNNNNYTMVHHKNGITYDNRVSNLEWVDAKLNNSDYYTKLRRDIKLSFESIEYNKEYHADRVNDSIIKYYKSCANLINFLHLQDEDEIKCAITTITKKDSIKYYDNMNKLELKEFVVEVTNSKGITHTYCVCDYYEKPAIKALQYNIKDFDGKYNYTVILDSNKYNCLTIGYLNRWQSTKLD